MSTVYCFLAILYLLFSDVYSQVVETLENGDNSGDGEGVEEVEDEDEITRETVIDDAFNEWTDDVEVEEEKVITSSPDVVPSSLFPRYPDARLPIGKVIELLIGFKNTGQKTFNVTYIHGSYRYPTELSIFIQNFTSWRGGVLVRPNQHVTFQYFFYPDDLLEPKDYVLIATALYSDDENINYTTTFFNGTIRMTDDSTPMDFQTIFTYFLILSIFGLVGYVLYTNMGKKGGSILSAAKSFTSIETGTRNSASQTNDYLEDSNFAQWKKQNEKAKKKTIK